MNIKSNNKFNIRSTDVPDEDNSSADIVLEKRAGGSLSQSRSNKSSESDPDEYNEALDEVSEPSRCSSVRPERNPAFKKLRLSDQTAGGYKACSSELDAEQLDKEADNSLFIP